MMTKEGVFSNLGRLPKWLIKVVMVLTIFGPILIPLNIPLPITEHTSEFYDYLKSIPPGSDVLFVYDESEVGYPLISNGVVACMNYFIDNDIHVTVLSFDMGYLTYFLLLQEPYARWAGPTDLGYGTQNIYLGLLVGGAPAQIDAATDVYGQFSVDNYGNTVADLPIVQNLKAKTGKEKISIVDFDLVLLMSSTALMANNFWAIPYGDVPYMVISMERGVMDVLMFYPTNFDAVLIGIKGQAELERLLDIPGFAGKSMDVMSATLLFAFILIVFSNIAWFGARAKKVEAV